MGVYDTTYELEELWLEVFALDDVDCDLLDVRAEFFTILELVW